MVCAMRANFPSPRCGAAGRRSLPGLPLAALSALVLAGCASSVPLPPLPPVPSPPPAPAPAPVQPPPAAPAVRDPQLAAFSARLDGRNQVPPVHSMGTGTIDAVLDRDTGLLRWRIRFSNLSGPVTAMHLHGPADVGSNAPPLITFNPPFESPWEGRLTLTPAQRAELLAGRWYLNIHTARNPAGELRGQLIERR